MRFTPLLATVASLLMVHRQHLAAQDAPPVPAGPQPLPLLEGRPDAPDARPDNAALPLGKPFRSQALGLTLRPPAGFKTVRRLGGEEVHFVDEQRNWTLKVSRITLTQDMGLESTTDPRSNLPRAGLLDLTVERLKAETPGAALLRHDVVNLGDAEAGMIVLRHVQGLETVLSQQALIRSDDRVYFMVALNTPGAKRVATGAANGVGPGAPEGGTGDGDSAAADPGDRNQEDPGEKQAVETFNAVLDSVELLDQRPLRREQEDRVYATLAFYVNANAAGKLENVLVPRQWFRVLRGGKDIGYLYTVEEMADGIPGHKRAAGAAARARGKAAAAALAAGGSGILIGMRSRTLPDENVQVDSESWLFCTPDRRNEQWSTLTVVQDRKSREQDHAMTVGTSSWQSGRVLDQEAHLRGERGDKNDPGQPPMAMKEDYQLTVTHVGKTDAPQPLSQELPRHYLPQALGHLLPRILPLREPKKFLFAAYVGDARAVMHRYVDVGAEKRITWNGEPMRAIPIGDRIGLEGSVTTHYVTSNGKYIGSENADSGIVMMPSDERTLLKIWKDADLNRPADVKEPEAPTAAGNPGGNAAPNPTGTVSGAGAGPRPPRDRLVPATGR